MSILDDASLVITPTAYKEDKLYSIVPKDGSGDLTWIRATDGTRINKDGYVERVPYNLLQYSNSFNTSPWSLNSQGSGLNPVLTPNAGIAPDGTNTAFRLQCDTVSLGGPNRSRLTQNINVKLGYTYTLSMWVKSYNENTQEFSLTNNACNVDSGFSNRFYIGNQWTFIRWKGISIVDTLSGVWMGLIDPITTTTNDVLIWNAQFTESSEFSEHQNTLNRLDVPRITYPTTGGTPSILIEPQRTNLLLYSERFNNSYWNKLRVSVTNNFGVSPDGNNGANLLTVNSVGACRVWANNTGFSDLTSGTTYSLSCYCKKVDTNLEITVGNLGEDVVSVRSFNFDTKTFGGVSGPYNTSTSYEELSNGWFRILVSTTIPAEQTTLRFSFHPTSNSPIDSKLLIWGQQLELGSYPTSYIPTTTSIVTRNADIFNRNNIYTNDFITSSGGSWYIELENNLSLTRDLSSYGIYLGDQSNGNGGNSFYILNPSSGPVRLHIYKRVNNTATLLYVTTTNHIKILIKWNGTTADVFLNGTKIVTSTSFTSTTLEYLNGSGSDVPKYIKSLALFPIPITDSEAIALTTL